MDSKGQSKDMQGGRKPVVRNVPNDFVLEKGIFSNIFEKDIRRVYIYKKSERLAKAIHLVSPAFRNSPALRDRMDRIAIGLVDAAILPPTSARDALSKELLALSSVLSIARTGGLLSPMNAEMIGREAQQLLQEIATYEEPRLFLDDAPSLAELAKEATRQQSRDAESVNQIIVGEKLPDSRPQTAGERKNKGQNIKGHKKDNSQTVKSTARREAILSILQKNGPSFIKDVSTVIRDVSEKTIQRELQSLVEEGRVTRTGERRWTSYSLV